MVSVEYGGVIIIFDVMKGIGGWIFMLIGVWVDGDYILSVLVEDKVGNISYFVLLMVMVDM